MSPEVRHSTVNDSNARPPLVYLRIRKSRDALNSVVFIEPQEDDGTTLRSGQRTRHGTQGSYSRAEKGLINVFNYFIIYYFRSVFFSYYF